MGDERTTSTFIIHHDRCEPRKWTAADVLKLAHFVQWGDLASAAALARLGMQLISDERHEPKGGELERIGVAFPDALNEFAETYDELDPDEDVFEVVPIYRGPIEYIARIGIGNDDGNFEGYEYEVKESEAEARKLVDDAMVDINREAATDFNAVR